MVLTNHKVLDPILPLVQSSGVEEVVGSAGTWGSGFDWGNVGVTREFNGGLVLDTDGVTAAWLVAVEDGVEGVLDTIVGEDLELLLDVVGAVQQFDDSVQLTGVGLDVYTNLPGVGIKRERSDSVTTLHDFRWSADGFGDLGADVVERRLGVRAGDLEWVFHGSDVADFDFGNLAAGSDEDLTWEFQTIITEGLQLHGGPVGTDPQLDVSGQRTSHGGHGELDGILVDIVEAEGLTRVHTFASDWGGDAGEVPAGGFTEHRGLEGGGSRAAGGSGESSGRLNGGEDCQGGCDDLHG